MLLLVAVVKVAVVSGVGDCVCVSIVDVVGGGERMDECVDESESERLASNCALGINLYESLRKSS